MKGVVISVDYGDILSITLPRNAKHFEQIVVGTTPHDLLTQRVCKSVPNVVCHVTDDFYKDGAAFNKGIVVESLLDIIGRWKDEFLTIFDADILMPDDTAERLVGLRPGYLYTPHRRMLTDPSRWSESLDWRTCPRKADDECAGYFQHFYSNDPCLQETPWYGIDWTSAGGPDSDFTSRWSIRRRIMLNWCVLHLGEDCKNWCGRTTKMIGGEVPAEAEARTARLRELMRIREETGGRHEHEKIGDRGW
jgi:hypothetical protein